MSEQVFDPVAQMGHDHNEIERLRAAIEAAALELETPSPDDPPDWRMRLAARLREATR